MQASKTGMAIVIAVTLALLTVPLSTVATHNSYGAVVSYAQADEFDRDTGELLPDIGSDLRQEFHDNLDTARLGPEDQTGDRYTDCEKGTEYDDAATYEAALKSGDACYVGYLDAQWEYLMATSLFLVKQPSDGDYWLNPSADDGYCRGTDETNPTTSVGAVDQALTRADRALNDPECQGDGHNQYWLGQVQIDTDVLEAPFAGAGDVDGAGSVTTPAEGSGYMFQPWIVTPYVFIFGQPHPDNENPSSFEAGEGVFGPNPAAGGNPLTDITNACGDRTKDCRLLTPEDIKLYDTNKPDVDDDQARVCDFRPQFVTVNPDDRSAGVCGVFGDVVNQFLDVDAAGGFDIPGAPSTFTNTQPGWYEGVLMITAGEPRNGGIRLANEYVSVDNPTGIWIGEDADGEIPDGIQQFVAINPAVPEEDHPLWCARPNFLATGVDQEDGALNDPGLYGTYIADAVDADLYRSPLFDQHQLILASTHSTVRPHIATAEATVDNAAATVTSTVDSLPVPQFVVDAVEDTADRTDFVEDNDAGSVDRTFTIDIKAGLSCDALGVVRAFDQDKVLDGEVVMNTNLAGQTVQLKDPTLLDGSGLPARQSETNEGAWQVDAYSFGGSLLGIVDSNENGENDACAAANGQPQPENDFCPWKALWDAHNPECTGFSSRKCIGLLDEMGYDVNGTGVGAFFVLKVSGPVVVVDEDRSRPAEITGRSTVLGTGNAAAQNCVVGVSLGFDEYLPALLSARTGETLGDMDDVRDHLCSDVDGESAVILDAYDDQSGTNRGSFSAAIQFIPLAPTPDAVASNTGIGSGDELCTFLELNVRSGETATDTTGSVELTGLNSFQHCLDLQQSIQ